MNFALHFCIIIFHIAPSCRFWGGQQLYPYLYGLDCELFRKHMYCEYMSDFVHLCQVVNLIVIDFWPCVVHMRKMGLFRCVGFG